MAEVKQRGRQRGLRQKASGCCPRGLLAAPEGLHFLPTPLAVQISFGDNLGVNCSTGSKLLNQILIWPQTPMNCLCRFGEAGAQMGQSPFWEPGRQTRFLRVSRGGQHAEEALMQSPHNFFPEGWGWGGTPGALIQLRSPQFGDSRLRRSGRLERFHSPREWRELAV